MISKLNNVVTPILLIGFVYLALKDTKCGCDTFYTTPVYSKTQIDSLLSIQDKRCAGRVIDEVSNIRLNRNKINGFCRIHKISELPPTDQVFRPILEPDTLNRVD